MGHQLPQSVILSRKIDMKHFRESCFGGGAVVDQLLGIISVNYRRTGGGHRLMFTLLPPVLEEPITQHC